MSDQRPPPSPPGFVRYIILGFTLALFGIGSWIGLQRFGWQLPDSADHIRVQLGPIMVSGLLGSAIVAERAVALTILDRSGSRKIRGHLWWSIPVVSAAGGLVLFWPDTSALGRWLITAASLGFMAMTLRILDLIPHLNTLMVALGGAGWAFGNLLWLGGANYSILLPAWALFIILTIIGEQFELLNLRLAGRWVLASFYSGGGLVIAGAFLSPLNSNFAVRLSGLGALILALGLVYFELSRERGRMSGLSRFSALAVQSSLGWLGLYGILALRIGFVPTDPTYRALTHCLLLGFGAGMLAGQAPFSLPALLDRRVVFHPWLMTMLSGLHISLALLVLGDILLWPAGRLWGGLLIILLGLVYTLLLIIALWTARHAE
jgi:hypothetical protein